MSFDNRDAHGYRHKLNMLKHLALIECFIFYEKLVYREKYPNSMSTWPYTACTLAYPCTRTTMLPSFKIRRKGSKKRITLLSTLCRVLTDISNFKPKSTLRMISFYHTPYYGSFGRWAKASCLTMSINFACHLTMLNIYKCKQGHGFLCLE